MLDRHTATARLGRQMRATEKALSEALVETTALIHTAALAQLDVSAPATLSYAPLRRMQKMLDGVLTAQADAARVHGHLVDVSKVVNGPETPDCPDETFFTTGTSESRAA